MRNEEAEIFQAIRSINTGAINNLIDSDAGILDFRDINKDTPLHLAARLNNILITALLLEKGADVTTLNRDNKKAMQVTANEVVINMLKEVEERNDALVTTLKASSIEADALACLQSASGGAVLDRAVTEKFSQPITRAIVECLNENSTDVAGNIAQAADREVIMRKLGLRQTEDDLYIYEKIMNSEELRYGELLRVLSEFPALIPSKDLFYNAKNQSLIHNAVEDSNIELVNALIDSKPSLMYALNGDEQIPLESAIYKGNEAVVRALIEKGGSLERQDFLGDAPIHLAVKKSTFEVVKFLAMRGGVDLKNSDGFTPLIIAARCNRSDIAGYLLSHGANIGDVDNNRLTVLHHAAAGRDNIVILDTLVQFNSSIINQRDRNGHTPLWLAVGALSQDNITYLLANGADVNIADKYGITPLMAAVEGNSTEVMRALIEAGADVNKSDIEGRTALSIAIANGKEDVIALLAPAQARPAASSGALVSTRMVQRPAAEKHIYGHPGLALEETVNTAVDSVFSWVDRLFNGQNNRGEGNGRGGGNS